MKEAAKYICAVCTLLTLCASASAARSTTTLKYGHLGYTDTQDAYIEEDAEDTNYGSLFYAHVTLKLSDHPEFSAPIRFGLPASLTDTTVTIHTAKLGLYVYQTIGMNNEDEYAIIAPYRIDDERGWVENQVTWNHYKTGSAWSTNGCEHVYQDRYGNPPEDQIRFDETSAAGYYEWTVTNTVNSWKGGYTNNGWLMRVYDTDGGLEDGISFYTREASGINSRPYLDVTWTQTPIADADGSYMCPYAASISLDGTGSYDRDIGPIQQWDWYLDAGDEVDKTGSMPEVTWDYLVNELAMTPGETYDIRLKVLDDDNEWSEFATTQLTVEIPEPATLGLLVVGGAGVLLVARRRRAYA